MEVFRECYLPYYQRANNWIHEHTDWKILKHNCGAVRPLIPLLIESGFDALNPVQTSADHMDPQELKDEFGKDISFWGGGVDTQRVLPFGTRKRSAGRCSEDVRYSERTAALYLTRYISFRRIRLSKIS